MYTELRIGGTPFREASCPRSGGDSVTKFQAKPSQWNMVVNSLPGKPVDQQSLGPEQNTDFNMPVVSLSCSEATLPSGEIPPGI